MNADMNAEVLAMFPDAHLDFFSLTGAWRVYPDRTDKSFPIGISTTQEGAIRQALDEVYRFRSNAEYAARRKTL